MLGCVKLLFGISLTRQLWCQAQSEVSIGKSANSENASISHLAWVAMKQGANIYAIEVA